MLEFFVFVYDIKYVGKSCFEKIVVICIELKKKSVESVMLLVLDEIVWILNLCGNDVYCNLVVVSYLFIIEKKVVLFIVLEKVIEGVWNYLEE